MVQDPFCSCKMIRMERRLLLDSGGSTREIVNVGTSDFASIAYFVDGSPSVNDNGDVAFLAMKDSGVTGIYLITADGTLTTVAESGVPPVQFGPRINNNGTVTFAYGADAYYWQSGAAPIDIAALSPQLSSSPNSIAVSNLALNNSGTAVISILGLLSQLPGGGIFASAAGAAPQLLIKGSGSVPGNVYGATINDSGAIAYFTR
jgi:hypothetical protein